MQVTLAPVMILLGIIGGSVGVLASYANQSKIIFDTLACSVEVRQCPDGSYVARVPGACQFQACPFSVKESSAQPSPAPVSTAGGSLPPPQPQPAPLPAPTPVSNIPLGWSRYRNTPYGFQFWYPADHVPYASVNLNARTFNPADGTEQTVSIAENEQIVFSAPGTAAVLTMTAISADVRLEDWVDQHTSDYVSNPSTMTRTDITFAKKKAVQIVQPTSGQNSPHRIIIAQPGNYLVVITESAPSAFLDQILNTFAFIQ